MIPMFRKWIKSRPKTRLKPPEQVAPKGARAFLAGPMFGRFIWFSIWCLILILASTVRERDATLKAGRPSPLTIVSMIEFVFDGPSPDGRDMVDNRIPAGTMLVERGRMVTPEAVAAVRAYRAGLSSKTFLSGRPTRLAGNAVILLIGVFVSAAMLRLLVPETARRNSMLLLFLTISMLTILPARWYHLLERLQLSVPACCLDFLLPFPLASLLAAILLGPLAAMVMGFWIGLTVAVFYGYSLAVFVTGFTAAVVLARVTRFVRTRSTVLRMGAYAGAAGAVCALGFSAASHYPLEHVLLGCALSMVSGIVSALVALLLLPFFETIFGVTTDISLLELSDFEHPLLKRLAIEAPGTYHHSLMVANLAQAAIKAIGGNTLRVSICSYFHDIGKLVKPTFFSENTQFAESPHEDLSPSMSTLVVISHVKEGVNLALRHKLPKPVVDAIQQHHGTGLVYYFYRKARANMQMELDLHGKNAAHDVNEEDFRYAGPKPQSRAIAVLSLADSIEAGSRSLEKTSTSHVEHLVDDIVDAKLRDGQLDECGLTLSDISSIKKAFIFTLTNMLHGRVSYPSNEDRNKQQADIGAPEHETAEKTGPAPDGAGGGSRSWN